MKNFPSNINVENKNNFKEIQINRLLCYLRRDIYEHILSHTEDDYFFLDNFNKRVNDIEQVKELVRKIIPELEQLGWKCKLSYGDTGLFIYSSEQPPKNCWEI
jgi:hypothetical protein